MIRIYCDWNDGIDEKHFGLECAGSVEDLRTHARVLKDGMRVLFYQTDELEAEGTLSSDSKKKSWLAIPDFTTKRYIGRSAAYEPKG